MRSHAHRRWSARRGSVRLNRAQVGPAGGEGRRGGNVEWLDDAGGCGPPAAAIESKFKRAHICGTDCLNPSPGAIRSLLDNLSSCRTGGRRLDEHRSVGRVHAVSTQRRRSSFELASATGNGPGRGWRPSLGATDAHAGRASTTPGETTHRCCSGGVPPRDGMPPAGTPPRPGRAGVAVVACEVPARGAGRESVRRSRWWLVSWSFVCCS